MAGRYEGWHHKKGASEASPEDLAGARKVLGELENQLKLGGIESGVLRKQLSNGTLVEARIDMGVPQVKITPGRPGQVGRRDFAGNFVVTARTQALPDGHEVENPQQALRTNPQADNWATLTFSGSDVARSDGTFVQTFPKGLGRAGNIDWVSADGERISWYGPSSRMFPDAYITPAHLFGKFVFHLGQPLLDVEAYITDSEDPFPDRFITGAALVQTTDGLWLYCMQNLGQNGVTTVAYPPGTDVIYDYPLAPQTDGGLHRYRLVQETTPEGVKRYRIKRGSREKLATLSVGHTDVWFFNQSGTEMVCHQILPNGFSAGGNPWWVARLEATGDYPPAAPPDAFDEAPDEFFPATSCLRRRVALSPDGTTANDTYSVVSGGAAVPLCTDYAGDTLRSYTLRLGADMVPYVGFDGQELPTLQIVRTGTTIAATWRWVLYASPRDQVIVFLGDSRTFDYETGSAAGATVGEVWVETWVKGVQVSRTTLATPPLPNFGLVRRALDNLELMGGLVGQSIAPSWFIYGLFQSIEDVPDAPPDEEPDTWVMKGGFIGFNAGLANLVFPGSCYFGSYSSISSGGPQPIGNLSGNPFSGSQQDEDGHYSVLSTAVDLPEGADPIVLLSIGLGLGSLDTSFALATNETLSNLTGISGAGQRYHPLWALGKVNLEQPKGS